MWYETGRVCVVWSGEGRVWIGRVGVHHAVCGDISYGIGACCHVHVDIDFSMQNMDFTLNSSDAPEKQFIGIDPQVLHGVFQ